MNKNKNLAAMQRAIILMEEAQKMYVKALNKMKAECKELEEAPVVVKVEVEVEKLPDPPAVVEVPESVYVDLELQEEIAVANKLCLLADLGDVKGEYIRVGLKQFFNENSTTPYLSRYHLNVTVVGDKEVSRYIRIEQLGNIEMYLRKKGALSWNKNFEPNNVILSLK